MRSPDSSRPFPRLHVITPDEVMRDGDFLKTVERLQEACGPGLAIHLRARRTSSRLLYETALEVVRSARALGGWCVVNGRTDVARAAGADAVQLGRTAPPLRALRPHLGNRLRAGVSVHGRRAAARAAEDGAYYLLLGTIFPTASHPGRRGAGPGLVREVASALAAARRRPPLVAIGGIVDAGRASMVRSAGAVGVAVQRAVWASPDPVGSARDLLLVLERPAPGSPSRSQEVEREKRAER